MKLVILFLLLACQPHLQEAKKVVTPSAVVNGSKVQKTDPLFRATVFLPLVNGGTCTGTLISSNVVLTAAHCLNDDYPPFAALLGSPSEGMQLKIKKYLPHPGFDFDEGYHDVGLIFLEEDAPSAYKPLKIHTGEILSGNLPLTVAGFSPLIRGQRKNLHESLAGKKLGTYDRVNTRANGPYSYSRNVIFYSSSETREEEEKHIMFYSQFAGGACSGDSGGPTVVKLAEETFLVGVNHAAVKKQGKIDCESIATSTLINPYREWIEENILKEQSQLPVFSNSQGNIDPDEKACADHLAMNLNVQTSLYSDTEQYCKFGLADIKAGLLQESKKCPEVCGKVAGFSGYCEYIAQSIPKILESVKGICKFE